MAHKKTKRRRKSKGLSNNSPVRRRKSKGLFDGVMSGANLKNSLVNTGLGMAGGAGATVGTKITNLVTKGNTIGNIVVGGIVGFIASAMGAPKIGIGYSGGATALALAGAGLKDNGDFADDDALEEGEVYQTESGEFVKMLNDGTMEYLSDEEVNALMDGDNVYPEYSTMNSFQ